MENYLTIMERKPTQYERMVTDFLDLIDFYDTHIKYNSNDHNWEYFRKNWNLFLDRYPRSLLKKIIANQNIEHL